MIISEFAICSTNNRNYRRLKSLGYEFIIIEEGPTISYLFEGIDRKYHSDFYLPNFNLICEIKSEYIYNKEVKINEIKKESSIKSGYNFIFIIDKDYSNFIKIIENNVNSAF